jgi:hypothetical protein
VRDLVMVIADLFLPPEAAATPSNAGAALPGLERAARFGVRAVLAGGWRSAIARRVGRPDLGARPPAQIAAAVLEARAHARGDGVTSWIATPVHLSAGLARVHLDHRGLLRLTPAELATLASEFGRTFGSAGATLTSLPAGDFLLRTPGVAALPASEPARWAGGDVAPGLPQGPAAGALRRLVAEIEMWLHTQPLNEARQRRGELPVTTLWPWGARGEGAPTASARQGAHVGMPGAAPPAAPPAAELPAAYGRDAWLQGAWHLLGGACRPVPRALPELLAGTSARCAVVVTEVGDELQRCDGSTVMEALARLDARLVWPAWQALASGALASFTLIVNDVSVRAHRASRFKLWRRRQAGLRGFA